nr:hypothetical protein B0A51_18432 [Rachicladosporium sp. CCFEE 5018]
MTPAEWQHSRAFLGTGPYTGMGGMGHNHGTQVGLQLSPVFSAPRGPLRKPRKSGFALWVGNLPPAGRIADLKDHFSRDATTDIESLFLIAKSNCAFVNYRTEAACSAAMHRFHDSRFDGVRLRAPQRVDDPSAQRGCVARRFQALGQRLPDFSANESGEYFGYARMLAPISGDLATAASPVPPEQSSPDDGPQSIPTPATATAPSGCIIDDSARGTIFWEADDLTEEDGFSLKEQITNDATAQ